MGTLTNENIERPDSMTTTGQPQTAAVLICFHTPPHKPHTTGPIAALSGLGLLGSRCTLTAWPGTVQPRLCVCVWGGGRGKGVSGVCSYCSTALCVCLTVRWSHCVLCVCVCVCVCDVQACVMVCMTSWTMTGSSHQARVSAGKTSWSARR